MSRPVLFAFAVIIGFSLTGSSCHKVDTPAANNLVGRWELSVEMGGIAGTITYPSGNGNILQFNNSGSFTQFYATGPSRAGTYQLEKAGHGPLDQILLLSYNGFPPAERDSVRITGDRIIFLPMETCCDIPTTTYLKIN